MSKPTIKNQVFKVAFHNAGGELDSVVVFVPESRPGVRLECKLKAALLRLIQDVDHLDAGDAFFVTQIS